MGRTRISLQSYTLRFDVVALVVASVLVLLIVGLAQREVRTRILESARADAGQFDLFLSRQLQLAEDELTAFATTFPDPPMTVANDSVHFTDLYRLSRDFEIREVIQSTQQNRLFPGFHFGPGKMTAFLQRSVAEGSAVSGFVRGYEVEKPSVYVAIHVDNAIFMGHLNLEHYHSLLASYADMSGKEMLLVSDEGLVMLRSSDSVWLPTIGSHERHPLLTDSGPSIELGGKAWIQTDSAFTPLQARLVVLTPATLLSQLQNVLWGLALVLLLMLMGFIAIRHQRMSALVTRPLRQLADRFEDVAEGRAEAHALPALSSTQSLSELDELAQKFARMAEMVESRQKNVLEEQEKLRTTLDRLPIALAISVAPNHSLASPIRYINQTFIDTFGYTLDEIPTIGDWASLAYPDSTQRKAVFARWIPEVTRAIAQQNRTEAMEFKVHCKDGTVRDILFEGVGQGNELIITLLDLTERRAIEASLRSAEEALQRTAYELIENIPVGTYTMIQPADGGMADFSFVSQRFLELLDFRREDVIGEPTRVFQRLHPDDVERWTQLNIETFEQKKPFYGEVRVIVHGEVRWVSAESIPRTLPDGSTLWEGVMTDITQQKAFEQALLQEKQRAEHLEKMKSRFLANMSHEIRTPLTIILGLNRLLLTKNPSPVQAEMLEQVERSGETLLRVINDVLDLSKIESGHLQIQQRAFRLSELLQTIEQRFRALLPEQLELRLTVELPSSHDNDLVLMGDAQRIEQVLTNLLSNALKFTPSGLVELSVSALFQTSTQAKLLFRVHDTGQGIDPALLETLFMPFTQVDDSATRTTSGTGLGLSISKQLVELMGGEIGAESTPEIGSTFWFELTFGLGQPSDLTPTHRETHTDSHHAALAGLHVLVVEDSPTIRALVQQLLYRKGIKVQEATNGENAVALLRAQPVAFDAVLMDIQMPVMDGLTAIRAIRETLGLRILPIIAMTAGVLEDEQQRALEAGADDILGKPIDAEQLYAMLYRSVIALDNETPSQPSEASTQRPESGSAAPELERLDAAFLNIPGINPLHAAKNMDHSGALFRTLLELFIQENSNTREQIEQAAASRNLSKLAQLTHKLRGGAAQLGATELAAATTKLGEAAKQNSTDLDALLADFITEAKRLGL